METEEQPDINLDNINDLINNDYHENRTYEAVEFGQYEINGHAFEECIFKACHFNKMSLVRTAFSSCMFIYSEIVISKLENITLNSVRFTDTKIMGMNFADCNPFGFQVEFENCLIDSTVYYANNLKKGKYINCRIRNTDFIECDMREMDFSMSNFEKTTFQKCNLEKADFRSACNYEIDPFNNRIKKAKFSLPEAQSFLGFLGIEIE